MNTITKKCVEIELHRIKLTFQHVRINRTKMVNQLTTLIERHGQLVPIIVVGDSQQGWTLIDGYLRVQALKRLGADTAMSETWHCEPEHALLQLLMGEQSLSFDVIEEAMLLQELRNRYDLSLEQIALQIGRDKSWVSRRLSLVDDLPEAICQAVMKGSISIWSATRILSPLARANETHALCLVNYLITHSHSTRELGTFFNHYQCANRKTRQHMVNKPALFFKANQTLLAQQKASQLTAGPEQQWSDALALCAAQLKPLTSCLARVFYEGQEVQEQETLLNQFTHCKQLIEELDQHLRNLRYVRSTKTSNHSRPSSGGQEQTRD